MYFNPDWRLSQEEWIFIYAHELLHLPRNRWKEGAIPLRASAPVFRVLKESPEPE